MGKSGAQAAWGCSEPWPGVIVLSGNPKTGEQAVIAILVPKFRPNVGITNSLS